jgi:hypothetical protein
MNSTNSETSVSRENVASFINFAMNYMLENQKYMDIRIYGMYLKMLHTFFIFGSLAISH